MKTKITILLTCIIGISLKAQVVVQTGSLSVRKTHHCGELLNNGKVLVFGGSYFNWGTASSTYYNSAELYNPNTGTWTSTGNMQLPRAYATSVLLDNGNVMVCGGMYGPYTQSCEIYDVTTGTWSYTDSIHSQQLESKAVKLNNGKILFVGGSGSCELYDQTSNTWTLTGNATFSGTTGFDIALLPNGNVLGTGGDPGAPQAKIYDVTSGTWGAAPNQMNNIRAHNTSITMTNGKVLVASGSNTMTSEVFDPSAGTFTSAGSLPDYFQSDKMINLTNGQVVISGSSFQLFNPVSNTWSSIATTKYTGDFYTVHRLQNGKILFAGGDAHSGLYSYLFDESQITTTGIQMEEGNSLCQVYPNPANENITIKVDVKLLGSVYSFIDQLGRTVLTGTLTSLNSDINISELSSGCYLLKVGENKPISVIKK